VSGTAEFTGYDLSLHSRRIENLRGLLRKVLPDIQLDPAGGRPWCGLRPMSPDGVPFIGQSPLSNLWLNCGHGHLGWTLAAGSAQLLADMMQGKHPAIDPSPYAFKRRVLS
jgi:D-amino-acid dehydrogenase